MTHTGLPHEPTLIGAIVAILVAGFGGAAKTLNSFLQGEPLQIARLLAQAAVSMFTGYMFYALSFNFGYDHLGTVIAGLGGWWGAEGVDFLIRRVKKEGGESR